MPKSDYLERKVLDYIFSQATFSPIATLYIGLFTVIPNDSAGSGTEVTGGSYARVAITNNVTNFPAASGTNPTTKSNGTVITFPQASASWGTVLAFAVFDASTAGNMLYWGPVSPEQTINNGVTASYAVGALQFTES